MSRFLEISKGIVEDFLQTAVFWDDRAVFPNDNVTNGVEFSSTIEMENPETGETTIIRTPQISEQNEHDLNAKTIIDTFMQKGIVCSVIRCEESTFEEQRGNYLKLMKKADIIVLDWDLFGDGGEKIVEIIKNLMIVDAAFFELRSIVIYTANSLSTVIERLSREDISFSEGEYRSNANLFTTISLFNKRSLSAIPTRTAGFDQVVERCISEFTETVHGIVPNTAMAAIAEVRKNTHKLLGILNKKLDLAYLSHRSLLPIPEEAEKHLEEIIISELESIIHENKIGKVSNFRTIKKSPLIQNKTYQSYDFSICLDKGVHTFMQTNKEKKDFANHVKTCYTHQWYNSTEIESKQSEKALALLSLLQTTYTDKNKYLTLGVIIEEKKSGKKFLCMQPRCDSTRLESDTEFIFLELQNSREDKFDILLPSDEKYIVAYGREYRKTLVFTPKQGIVSASERLLFTSKNKTKYKYLATLKKVQAQRIANEYGAYISRVGLNESEYLRRNRPKG